MRQFLQPLLVASRDLRSRNRALHGRLTVRRAKLVVVVFCVACLGLVSTAVAASTTTTTLNPQNIEIAGNAYARHLLRLQPIPPDAQKVSTLPTPLVTSGGVGVEDSSHARSLYLLSMSVSVDQYVRAHLPKGERVTETGTGSAPNAYPTYDLGVSLTCVNPHVTFCGVYYTTTEAKNGQQELRIDVQVIYLPIIHEAMPTSGTVTVIGYGKISLMDQSSEPTSVVLTNHQTQTLRTVVAELKDLDGGICAEDSILLKIKVVQRGKVVWRAVADECPGSLLITTPHSTTTLDDRSCAFWHVVDSFFAPATATGTKSGSQVCADSQYG